MNSHCKLESNCKPKSMWSWLRLSWLFALAFAAILPKATADTCPAGATVTGPNILLTAFRSNDVTGVLTAIGGARLVGSCETIWVRATLSYVPRDIDNNI